MKPSLLPDVSITVPNLEAAVDFYTHVAGFQVTAQGANFIELTNGVMRWYLTQAQAPTPMFALQVEDVETTVAAFVAAGGSVIDARDGHTFVRDPFGIFICVES